MIKPINQFVVEVEADLKYSLRIGEGTVRGIKFDGVEIIAERPPMKGCRLCGGSGTQGRFLHFFRRTITGPTGLVIQTEVLSGLIGCECIGWYENLGGRLAHE